VELSSTHLAFPYNPERDPSLTEMDVSGKAHIERLMREYFGAYDGTVDGLNVAVKHDLVELDEAAA
jgi:hypothetical protein